MKFASRKAIYKLFLWIVTILVSLIFLVPLYWILISSLTDPNELFSSPINYFPSNLTFNNYIRLFVNLNIGQKTINTLIISAAAIVISTITCLMAAYAFSRHQGKLLSILFSFLLASALVPGVVTARPLYDFLKNLNLVDTYGGLTILYISALIPFSILILKNFLGDMPIAIEEAAEVDGANFIHKFFRIILPLMRPAIATICIINFITCLNDLFTPLFFSNQIDVLSVGITTIPKESSFTMPWDMVSTMGWFIVFPIIIFVLIFEENIMEGIMAGGVKQ